VSKLSSGNKFFDPPRPNANRRSFDPPVNNFSPAQTTRLHIPRKIKPANHLLHRDCTLPPRLLLPNRPPKPLAHHPSCPRLPLGWQNTSIRRLQWVAAAASPDTSPLTPLGMGADSAAGQIVDQQLPSGILITRGGRFQCKSYARREGWCHL
jgi:hypothetical protein